MIEPQNPMLPLAAEPRSVEHPQSETGGFGEMLAQTLGLVAPVDPNAIQQVPTQPEQQGHGEEETGAQDPSQQPAAAVLPEAVTSRIADLLARAAVVAPAPFEPVEATPGDGRIVKPTPEIGFPKADPVAAAPVTAGPVVPRLPETPQAAVENPPVDSKGATPNGAAQIMAATGAVGEMAPEVGPSRPPAATAAPADPVPGTPVTTNPAPRPVPIDGPVDPMVPPVAIDTPVGPPAGRLDPRLITPADDAAASSAAKADPLRRPPIVPTPTADGAMVSAAEVGPSLPQPAVARPTSTERIQLIPETPIRLDSAPRVVTENMRPVATGGTASQDGVIESPVVVPGSAAVPKAAAPATDAGPAATVLQQGSVLAERVMRAVDLQRTQPPPRSMVVDIPEVEGLRLVVSVRSGGHVTVTPASNSANPDAFVPFADDLSRVLADRGFVMNGDDRRRGHQPSPEDGADPQPAARRSFRRPVRVDNDLRI